MRHLIEIAAVLLYLWGWHKFGFKKASNWACILIISVYPFSFAGLFLPSILRFFGVDQISMPARILLGAVAIIAVVIAAKHLGLGKVLTGIFMGAMIVASVVVVGFLFLIGMAAIHATPEAAIAIAVLTIVLTAASGRRQQ